METFRSSDPDMPLLRVFKFRANNDPASDGFECSASSPCRLCAHAIDDHLGGVLFNNAGVYLYEKILEDTKKIPSIYAGQARHFASRTDNNTRLEKVDYVYLIGLVNTDTHPDKCKKMDENWRQHFEHLLIEHLYDHCIKKGFLVENNKREGQSFASDTLKKIMQDAYEKTKKVLHRMECYPFTSPKTPRDENSFAKVRARSNPGATKNVYNVEGRYDSITGAIEISKSLGEDKLAFISKGRWQVPMTYQQAKTSMIDAGYLKSGWACSHGSVKEREVYILTQDLTFANISEAVHVVANGPKAAKDVFEIQRDEQWVPFEQ